jgi:hypothetical protein
MGQRLRWPESGTSRPRRAGSGRPWSPPRGEPWASRPCSVAAGCGMGSARGPAGPAERRKSRIAVAAAWAVGPWDEGRSARTGRLRAPAAEPRVDRAHRFEQLAAAARQIFRGTQAREERRAKTARTNPNSRPHLSLLSRVRGAKLREQTQPRRPAHAEGAERTQPPRPAVRTARTNPASAVPKRAERTQAWKDWAKCSVLSEEGICPV